MAAARQPPITCNSRSRGVITTCERCVRQTLWTVICQNLPPSCARPCAVAASSFCSALEGLRKQMKKNLGSRLCFGLQRLLVSAIRRRWNGSGKLPRNAGVKEKQCDLRCCPSVCLRDENVTHLAAPVEAVSPGLGPASAVALCSGPAWTIMGQKSKVIGTVPGLYK